MGELGVGSKDQKKGGGKPGGEARGPVASSLGVADGDETAPEVNVLDSEPEHL